MIDNPVEVFKLGELVKGKRVRFDLAVHLLELGEYGKMLDGSWRARAPLHSHRLTANLSRHEVTEHDDGTITVTPSIEVTYPLPGITIKWHGYLERGIWRDA